MPPTQRPANGDLEATTAHRRRRVDTRRQANLRRWWRARLATEPITCEWCGFLLTADMPWHLDHIVPVAAGGTDDPANLTPLHAECNRAKAAQTMQPRPVTAAPPSRKW